MILFKKRKARKRLEIKAIALKLYNEMERNKREHLMLKQRAIEQQAYVLDLDKVTTPESLIKVIRLLDGNGMMFLLKPEEVTEYKDYIKKKEQ